MLQQEAVDRDLTTIVQAARSSGLIAGSRINPAAILAYGALISPAFIRS